MQPPVQAGLLTYYVSSTGSDSAAGSHDAGTTSPTLADWQSRSGQDLLGTAY